MKAPLLACVATGALAGLALVASAAGAAGGWYLLMPPVATVSGAPVVEGGAALSRWRKSVQRYESARECEARRAERVSALGRSPGGVRLARASAARCIASSDPRLAVEGGAGAAQAGWYLLSAPGPADPSREDPSAPAARAAAAAPPLAEWRHLASFDARDECETRRQQLGAQGGRPRDTAASECVAVGDRRLGGAAAP